MLGRNPSARYIKSNRFVRFNPPLPNNRTCFESRLPLQKTFVNVSFDKSLSCTLLTAGLLGPNCVRQAASSAQREVVTKRREGAENEIND